MNKLYIYIVFLILVCACSTNKPQTVTNSGNNSHYHIHKYEKTQPGDSAIVVVNAKRIDGDIHDFFILKINDSDIYRIKDDSSSVISLRSGPYTFEFIEFLSYKIKTREINLSAKDSVIINFYSKLNPIDN